MDSLTLSRASWYVAFQYNGVLSVTISHNGAVNVLVKLGVNGPVKFARPKKVCASCLLIGGALYLRADT